MTRETRTGSLLESLKLPLPVSLPYDLRSHVPNDGLTKNRSRCWIFMSIKQMNPSYFFFPPALKTPAGFHEKIRSLERARVGVQLFSPMNLKMPCLLIDRIFPADWQLPEAQALQSTGSLRAGPHAHPAR